LPPQPKALDEARGYVIADYQDALEKEWVEDLRQQYPVTVHQDVLSSLIRK
jgi:peptidyl-prolyl cis-trans isomerase SurA